MIDLYYPSPPPVTGLAWRASSSALSPLYASAPYFKHAGAASYSGIVRWGGFNSNSLGIETITCVFVPCALSLTYFGPNNSYLPRRYIYLQMELVGVWIGRSRSRLNPWYWSPPHLHKSTIKACETHQVQALVTAPERHLSRIS